MAALKLDRYRRACKIYKSRASSRATEVSDLKHELQNARTEANTLRERLEEFTASQAEADAVAHERRNDLHGSGVAANEGTKRASSPEKEGSKAITQAEEDRAELHGARMALASALQASRAALRDDSEHDAPDLLAGARVDDGGVAPPIQPEGPSLDHTRPLMAPAVSFDSQTLPGVGYERATTSSLSADLAGAIADMGAALREARVRVDTETRQRLFAAEAAADSTTLLDELSRRVRELEDVVLFEKMKRDDMEASRMRRMDLASRRSQKPFQESTLHCDGEHHERRGSGGRQELLSDNARRSRRNLADPMVTFSGGDFADFGRCDTIEVVDDLRDEGALVGFSQEFDDEFMQGIARVGNDDDGGGRERTALASGLHRWQANSKKGKTTRTRGRDDDNDDIARQTGRSTDAPRYSNATGVKHHRRSLYHRQQKRGQHGVRDSHDSQMYLLTAIRRSVDGSIGINSHGSGTGASGVAALHDFEGENPTVPAPIDDDAGASRCAKAKAIVSKARKSVSSVTSSMLDAKVDEMNMLRTELVEAQRRREDAEDVLRRLGNPC